jgi:hypothetical protein
MAPEVEDSKKSRKTSKMENCALRKWNRSVATNFHLYHSSPLRKQWSPILQVPPSDGETSVESHS